MVLLNKGDYFGKKKQVFDYSEIIVTNTFTSQKEAPWHYHENAYFSYFIQGSLQEINKRETYHCNKGTLLYHHSQEPHYNKNGTLVHNLNIELTDAWFRKYEVKADSLAGANIIKNPSLNTIFNQVYKEIIINDSVSKIAIEGLILQAFSILQRSSAKIQSREPAWVEKIRAYFHEGKESFSLEEAANIAQLHPNHLSLAFPKYFHSSFGDYIRKIRLTKAMLLLKDKRQSLTAISYECGFSDQSHFIRCFKEAYQITPFQYRKSVLNID